MNYELVATELKQRAAALTTDEQLWIGLVGAPGSGKSTLAHALQEPLGDMLAIIPMDGFHYYRHELDQMANPAEAYARRGAPFTFNAPKFVTTLIQARQAREGTFPSFDHHIGDPIEEDITLSQEQTIVLVEGNYLLLDEAPWTQLREQVFDETWFLDVPLEECNRRVKDRHMRTGLPAEEAQRRVDTNDSLNAQLVINVSRKNADRILTIEPS